ncbi:MAG TPA: ABC transporter permease [Bacteroidota bacterium]|nr:ABC transporter permease [Bacteroidota bacterium]
MKIPAKYIVRNLLTRRLTMSLTVAGIALVVFVFTAVLMMANGIRSTLVATGAEDNVIVLRKSAQAEISSIIGRDEANVIRTLPGIAHTQEGKPLVSAEVVVVINLRYNDESGFGNVTVRGVNPEGIRLRPGVRISEGRMFQWGTREIVVGSSITRRFKDSQIGSQIKFGGDTWTIVGVMSSDGSGFDSELWGDNDQLGEAFNRPVFSTVLLKLERASDFPAFKAAFTNDNRLQYFEVKPERQFYDEQSEAMATFVRILGIFVTVIFSAGAMIGAMITMYAAVANRTIEIGTLRALGFRRKNILTAFLLESLFLSLIGGGVGILLASVLQFYQISMINFSSFAELAFKFSLSADILVRSLVFSLIMGVIGGFLPAVRASRMNIVNALRSA